MKIMTTMTRAIGTKVVSFAPMTMEDYFSASGRECPAGMLEKFPSNQPGYLVEYEPEEGEAEGYQSWSPRDVFDKAYRSTSASMDFGMALYLLKRGHKLTRPSWNGPGQYVFYQKGYPDGIGLNKNTAEATGGIEGAVCVFKPYFMIQTEDGVFSHWVPSTGDLLADDWQIVSETTDVCDTASS